MTLEITQRSPQTLIDLADVQAFLYLGEGAQLGQLADLVDGCIDEAERILFRSLVAKTCVATYGPETKEIRLPGAPIAELVKVEVFRNNEWQADHNAVEFYDLSEYSRVLTTLPVRVEYKTGVYDSPQVKMLIKELIAARYLARGEETDDVRYISKRIAKHQRCVTM